MSDHEHHESPEEMFEPDGTSATALFFILGFMAVGLAVCVILIAQWFATAARAEKVEKGTRANPALVELEAGQRDELSSWGEVGCPEPEVPADAGANGDAPKVEPEPCSAAEMIYRKPIDTVIDQMSKSRELLAPGPAPAPAEGAQPPAGTQGNNAPQRQMRPVPDQNQRPKVAPGQGRTPRPRIEMRRAAQPGAGNQPAEQPAEQPATP